MLLLSPKVSAVCLLLFAFWSLPMLVYLCPGFFSCKRDDLGGMVVICFDSNPYTEFSPRFYYEKFQTRSEVERILQSTPIYHHLDSTINLKRGLLLNLGGCFQGFSLYNYVLLLDYMFFFFQA